MSQKAGYPNLRKTREQRGYTQRYMTDLLHYKGQSRYAQYEKGTRSPPVREAIRIANVLGETVEYLFGSGTRRK